MAIIEGELITKMRTAAVSAVATSPSPLRCSPFSAPERRQARVSKRSDMSATLRKFVSGPHARKGKGFRQRTRLYRDGR